VGEVIRSFAVSVVVPPGETKDVTRSRLWDALKTAGLSNFALAFDHDTPMAAPPPAGLDVADTPYLVR
jgi:hypothetical protein